jgi:membrane associated rhomboid family serine protease
MAGIPRWTPVVGTLIAINVAVFGLEVLLGATEDVRVLIWMGAAVRPLVMAGQVWRLVTDAFLHANLLHLGANMFSLWAVGRLVEVILGPRRFLVVYAAGAVCGSVLGLVGSEGPLVGASAAILALLAPLFVLTYRAQHGRGLARIGRTLGQWAPTIVLLAAQGALIPNISNLAHAGGVLGGALATRAVGTDPQRA